MTAMASTLSRQIVFKSVSNAFNNERALRPPVDAISLCQTMSFAISIAYKSSKSKPKADRLLVE